MARHFTSAYVEHATLRDGRPVLIRLLVAEDKDVLQRGFERWSQESRYARFLSPKQRLTDDELHYLCEIDQESHFALCAELAGVEGEDAAVGLGIARFIRLAGAPGTPVTAEAAIAVADEANHQGLGKLLFLRLVAAGAERGIERFRCEVLCSNASMRTLIDKIAPDHTLEVGGGVMSIDFALPPVGPDASPNAEAPGGGMYDLLRAASQGQIDLWRRGIK